MFDTCSEAIHWLQSQLPTFHLQGKTAFNPSLDIIFYLSNVLGNPHTKFRSVHIAGTNGKGSTACMLASILQEAGYKTALYTSPHLISFTERIKINGVPVSEAELLHWVNTLYPVICEMDKKPSFFEITTAIAFAHFAAHTIDIAVIETGLGGRLDATNILQPLLSVITRISYDHTDILGDTLAKIATEKAGIIKSSTPVLIGKRHTETDEVFISTARQKDSPILFVEDNWKSEYKGNSVLQGIHEVYYKGEYVYPNLEVGLSGRYQAENVALVCAVVDFLANNQWDIKDIHLYRGMKNIQKNVNLMGRMQVLSHNPLVIADIAHNAEGIQAVIQNFSEFNTIHAVLGILQDKDAETMIQTFPKNTIFYMITADTPRAIPAQELARVATFSEYKAYDYSSLETALKEAQKACKPNDVIYTGGSNYVVGKILALYMK